MWIKICANTNLEDALLAADLGADAVGFVFAPSPRQVVPQQASAITRHLPGSLETVGVFPAWDAIQIVEAVQQANLASIQLHGAADPQLIRTLHAHFAGSVPIMQVVHWNVDATWSQADEIVRQIHQLTAMPEIARVLIDSKRGSVSGGTGIAFPWEEARAVFVAHPKIVLAGGLNPLSVVEAIQTLRPWGVDVASGVEASSGRKDPAKLSAFLEAARRASSVS